MIYYLIIIHFWCNDHSTSISVSGAWEVRAEAQVSMSEFHTHIHLDYSKAEFQSYINCECNISL